MRRTLANPAVLQNETLVFNLSMFVRNQMPGATTNTNQSTQPVWVNELSMGSSVLTNLGSPVPPLSRRLVS